RRDSAGFLVDVVLQRRLGEITGRDAEEVLAEACWDDDRRIRVAALDCLEGFLVGHEVPAEIVVPPELLLDLIPDIDSTCQIGRRALIEVRHGDADVLRVRIRVPEGADVEPRVQRRGDENPDHDDPRLAYAGESADVAREHLPTSLHSNIVHATCTSLCTMRGCGLARRSSKGSSDVPARSRPIGRPPSSHAAAPVAHQMERNRCGWGTATNRARAGSPGDQARASSSLARCTVSASSGTRPKSVRSCPICVWSRRLMTRFPTNFGPGSSTVSPSRSRAVAFSRNRRSYVELNTSGTPRSIPSSW